MNEPNHSFLHSMLLDGKGQGVTCDDSAIRNWRREHGTLWVHLDVGDAASERWLVKHSGLPDEAVDILLADETRPRSLATEQGLLVILRGLNTNPGEDPEDMVSVRIWVDRDRIVSSQRRQLLAVTDISKSLHAGNGPRTPGQMLEMLVERIADRLDSFVESIEDRIAQTEDEVAADPTESRPKLASLRRPVASVRRFLAPQRDALDRLNRTNTPFLDDSDVQDLREEADRITRYLEDLDLARERAVVLQEELLSRLAQQQNDRMYVLSLVAAIFLPLTFVTGLLGMNVGGLPGVDNTSGFAISVVVMLVSGIAVFAYFRYKKWL